MARNTPKPIRILNNKVNGDYWYRTIGANGRILNHSENYPDKRTVLRGVYATLRAYQVPKEKWEDMIEDLTVPKRKSSKPATNGKQ